MFKKYKKDLKLPKWVNKAIQKGKRDKKKKVGATNHRFISRTGGFKKAPTRMATDNEFENYVSKLIKEANAPVAPSIDLSALRSTVDNSNKNWGITEVPSIDLVDLAAKIKYDENAEFM